MAKNKDKLIVACLIWLACLISTILCIRALGNGKLNFYRIADIFEIAGLVLVGYSIFAERKDKLIIIGGILCVVSAFLPFVYQQIKYGLDLFDDFGYYFANHLLLLIPYVLFLVSLFSGDSKTLSIIAGVFMIIFAIWTVIDGYVFAYTFEMLLIGVAFIIMNKFYDINKKTINKQLQKEANIQTANIDTLISLNNLREKGIISDKEFETKKKEILGDSIEKPNEDEMTFKLTKLKELNDKGIISEAEYQAKKLELLNEQ